MIPGYIRWLLMSLFRLIYWEASMKLIPFALLLLPVAVCAQGLILDQEIDFGTDTVILVEPYAEAWVPDSSQYTWQPWEHQAEVPFSRPSNWKTLFDGMERPEWLWVRLKVVGNWQEVAHTWLIAWNAYEVDMHWQNQGQWFSQRSGNFVPIDMRSVKRSFGAIPVMELPIYPGENVYYFRIKPGQVRVHERLDWSHGKLMTPAHYLNFDRKTRTFDSLVLGLILALAGYHLIIYFQVRRKEYLFFSIFGISLVIFLLNLKDYSLGAFWPNWPRWNYTGFTMAVGFLLFFTFARFSQHFLNMRKYVPKRNRLIDILLIISGIYILFRMGLELWAPAFHARNHPPFAIGIRIIWTFIALVTFWAAIGCYRHQPRIARRYLLTNALLVIVALMRLLSTNGVIGLEVPFPFIALTIVVQQIFFAFTLAAHINEIERARLQAEQERQEEEAKTRFFNSLTHELRTPLSMISGLAEQLQAQPGVRREFHLDLINRNVGHILSLINLMLDLARISQDRFKLNLVHTDLIPLLRWIVASFEPLAEEKDIKLQFFTEQKKLEMDLDPQAMQQVLINLIGNAIKFTPARGQVSLLVRIEAEQLQLSVVDTGKGMEPNQVRQIFTPFYQVEDGSHVQHKGTGIGLAIVKELVSQMEGDIKVESQINEGSSFILTLPITHEAEPSSTMEAEELPISLSSLSEMGAPDEKLLPRSMDTERQLLLIVDDHWEMRYMIRMALAHDYNLVEAQNGKEALELAQKHMPDAIITDVHMPEMDGNTLLKQLRTDASTNHIPVLMLTAKATENDRMISFRLGADGYLTKPFKREELLVRIARMTSRKWEPISQNTAIREAEPPTPEEALIKEFEQVVRKNFDQEHFDTQEFGRQMGLSRAQLHRKLKSLTGHAPGKFVTLIKMEQARSWLLTTDMQIQEIAWALGINDPSHFSRQYKSVYDETPRDTRQR